MKSYCSVRAAHCALQAVTAEYLPAIAEYGADGTYVQHINKAFAAAAAALMELMTGREGLPDMLQAFKSYFLLARGDLFTTFLELAETELERNATDVTVTRLQSLLELGGLFLLLLWCYLGRACQLAAECAEP